MPFLTITVCAEEFEVHSEPSFRGLPVLAFDLVFVLSQGPANNVGDTRRLAFIDRDLLGMFLKPLMVLRLDVDRKRHELQILLGSFGYHHCPFFLRWAGYVMVRYYTITMLACSAKDSVHRCIISRALRPCFVIAKM
jgi:hypothetical protein